VRLRCPRCALPLAHGRRTHRCVEHLGRTVTALDYAPPWQDVALDFKKQPQLAWAPALARLMQRAARTAELPLHRSRWWLPIPMAAARLRQRGFNHAWLLTQALARHSRGVAHAHPHVLQRAHDALPQHQRGRAQRLNDQVAWQVAEPQRVAGQSVLLIDDIMTTGATLDSAARCLRQAGAVRVDALVLARVPAP